MKKATLPYLAASAGASMVVTECPSCRMQLMDVLDRYAGDVKVADSAVLLRSRLKR